jgi:hypothetical protein
MLIAEVDIDISIRGPVFIRKISDFKTRKINDLHITYLKYVVAT